MPSNTKIFRIGLFALLFLAAFATQKTNAQDGKVTESCMRNALNLANVMDARVGQTHRSGVKFQQDEIETFIYECNMVATDNGPAIIMEWAGRRKPLPATASYVSRAAEFFSGTNQERFRRELDACIGASLKSDTFEHREWGRTKIECKAQDHISWVMIWQKARR